MKACFPNLGDGPRTFEQTNIAIMEISTAFPEATFILSGEQRNVYKVGTEAYNQAMVGMWGFCKVTPDDIERVTLYHIRANAFGWVFMRAWYYWFAQGPAIRESVARDFNEKWGEQVRVDGFAGGQNVTGPVDSYHIDTVEGLMAFAELIRNSH